MVAGLQRCDSGADFDDLAGKFMAEYTGVGGKGIFALINMYIGPADTCELYPNKHLRWTCDFGHLHFLYGDIPGFGDYCSFHTGSPRHLDILQMASHRPFR